MAATLNKVMLIGRLGRDPELKYSASGTPVTNFSMATDESYTDRDGNRVDRAEWHRIVVFNRQAETCANYLRKGSLCYVEGSLTTRKWQDQNGQDRYTTEVKAQRVQFLDPKGAGVDSAPSYEEDQGYQGGGYGGGQGGGQGGYGGGQARQGGYGGQRQQQRPPQQRQQAPAPQPQDEDLGPAFPSEASGMDDVPF
ncbi:MAG: single-stranded DNA-binding protein [Desulfovibrionaceae bacterium]|jgi:single-strand DNA-binding protein|nr:single-stranded DNA-binding protein [Desulfovibrionaceae bacterium]